jgi:hypothetical protein
MPPSTTISCQQLLGLLRNDEDFRWEFVGAGLDSPYVKNRLNLKGNPRSKVEKDREIASDELEAMATVLEQLLEGRCPNSGDRVK